MSVIILWFDIADNFEPFVLSSDEKFLYAILKQSSHQLIRLLWAAFLLWLRSPIKQTGSWTRAQRCSRKPLICLTAVPINRAIDQIKQAIGLLSNIRQLGPDKTSDLLVTVQRSLSPLPVVQNSLHLLAIRHSKRFFAHIGTWIRSTADQ